MIISRGPGRDNVDNVISKLIEIETELQQATALADVLAAAFCGSSPPDDNSAAIVASNLFRSVDRASGKLNEALRAVREVHESGKE